MQAGASTSFADPVSPRVRIPLDARKHSNVNSSAAPETPLKPRRTMVADDENFMPCDAAGGAPHASPSALLEATPSFVTVSFAAASPMTSVRIRKNTPYAPLVVHPGFLQHPLLPEAYMLDTYTALDTAVCIEAYAPACPVTTPHLNIDAAAYVPHCDLNASTPSTIHDASLSSAGDAHLPDRAQHAASSRRCRPGIPQNEFYRMYGPPRRAVHRPENDAANTSQRSSASSAPSERPRPEGRTIVDTSATRWRDQPPLARKEPHRIGVSSTPAHAQLARVRFAFRFQHFALTPDVAPFCPVGSMVIVEGDRGYDAGMLVDVIAPQCKEALPEEKIVRPATREEIDQFHFNRAEAESAIVKLRALLSNPTPHIHSTCSPAELESIELHACEFQLDGRKLIVHYSAPTRVRYGAIAAEAYKVFHCRIWMHQLNYGAIIDAVVPPRQRNH